MIGKRSLPAIVALLVVLATVATTPAAAAVWGSDNEPSQVTYGADATPSWHVHVEDGELATLESWAEGDESLDVLRTHNASNYALVTGSAADLGQRWHDQYIGNGLATKSYVVDVRPNYEHSLAEPVTPKNQSEVENPSRKLGILASTFGDRSADWNPSGVAYSDTTNESQLSDVRDVTGVSNVTETGNGATLAVIDSGVNHADGRIFGNGSSASEPRILNASKDFITNETVAQDGLSAVEDPNGHGTWVASAAAGTEGMAPKADILALRALDADGSGSTSDIAVAVRYAADNDADVIVMSLGSPVYDEELTDALEYAIDHNVSAIAIATGNSRQTTRWVSTPADVPVAGVTAVSATNTSSNGTAGTAHFANVGSDPGTTDLSGGATAGQDVDVSAPGMKVTAPVATTSGVVENRTLSGTSMAAPHVAGIALLGVESNEAWVGDAEAFNERARETACPMPNTAEIEVGAGMVAADRLLENETSGTQSEAMDEDAQARDKFWKGLSKASPWANPTTRAPVIG